MDAKYRTRLKVSVTYLSIIMLMSIIFSVVIYNISANELHRQRTIPIPRQFNAIITNDDLDSWRDLRLDEGRSNLRNKLILFNLSTLVFGAILSYVLALRSLEPIEQALERQNRFTSDASHEMRTPLTAIKTEIEVTLRDKNLSVKSAKDALKSNLEEIEKLEALTSGLLQLARHEHIDLPKDKINISTLINEAIDQVSAKAKLKNIKIIKPKTVKKLINIEPGSVRQALVIFLDNAIKYSPEKTTITVSYKDGRTAHQITVKDQGEGIDSQDLPHIFDRFYRSDKSRTKKTTETSGYGLGLAIAKQIIESHKGHINIKSQQSKGTSVTISLPK